MKFLLSPPYVNALANISCLALVISLPFSENKIQSFLMSTVLVSMGYLLTEDAKAFQKNLYQREDDEDLKTTQKNSQAFLTELPKAMEERPQDTRILDLFKEIK